MQASCTSGSDNLAAAILAHASQTPSRPALVSPLDRQPMLTFGELARRVARLRGGLAAHGVRPGDRVLVLAPLGPELVTAALALLAHGATLVTLDGRLDARRIAGALAVARPRAVISLRRLLRFWPLVPALARARRFALDGAGLGVRPFAALLDYAADDAPPRSPTAPAMVGFSSGTGGRPKGAERSHAILRAQHQALRHAFPVVDGDVDLPAFPALVLHNLACGVTTVVPPVDLRQPASIDPAPLLGAARQYGVITLSGAPAYLARVAAHVLRTGETLPSLRRIAVGGAPVSRALCRALRAAFPAAAGVVVYGSTEAEPIAHADLDQVAASDGDGFLVGAVDPAATVALVRLPDGGARATIDPTLQAHRVADGEVGEVVVRGEHVVRRYVGDPEAERRTKIAAPDGGVWHRTGDLARRDDAGRLWLSGRLGDELVHGGRALYPFDVEARVLDLAGVRAAALVAGAGALADTLAVAVEPRQAVATLAQARATLDARGLGHLPIRALPRLPMDARHQSKVDRASLRALLAEEAA